MLRLVHDGQDMAKLRVVLDDLVETAAVLSSLTLSVQVALEHLANVTEILQSTLLHPADSDLDVHGALWTGMNFDGLLAKMQMEAPIIAQQSLKLNSTQQNLLNYGRVNSKVTDLVQSVANIVPAWLALERAGISVCALVFDVRNLAYSMKCRIEASLHKSRNASSILADCREKLLQFADDIADESGDLVSSCATAPLSARITVAPLSGDNGHSSSANEVLLVLATVAVAIAVVCLCGIGLALSCKVYKSFNARQYSRADLNHDGEMEDVCAVDHLHTFGSSDAEVEEARTYIQSMSEMEAWVNIDGFLSVNDVVRINARLTECDLEAGLMGLVVYLDSHGDADVLFPLADGAAISQTRRVPRQDFDKLSVIRTPETFS